jgi:MoxR-like ATPase
MIPADWPRFFQHIYDREPQVRLILDTLRAAIASGWHVRNHCLLWGRPACGKTEILLSVEQMLGPDAVLKLDATMTSKAGAENLLLELDAVPPVLLIEELEKCDPANLPWLLGVLDQRGEVIKTNARIGSVRKPACCLCLATVNDLDRFRSVLSGALASRFQHQIYCPRPSRAVLRMILRREIHARSGKDVWIEPALDLCAQEGTDDPRRAIALLDGGDRLLSGEYQADWLAVRRSIAAERDGPAPSPTPTT